MVLAYPISINLYVSNDARKVKSLTSSLQGNTGSILYIMVYCIDKPFSISV